MTTFSFFSILPPAPSATFPWRQAGAHIAVAVPVAVPAYEEQVLWGKKWGHVFRDRYLPLTAENFTHYAKLIYRIVAKGEFVYTV